jgi:hypothetical protein
MTDDLFPIDTEGAPVRGPRSPAVHKPLTVRAQSGDRFGWRNVCTCGQRSGLLGSSRDADEYGRFHLATVAAKRP